MKYLRLFAVLSIFAASCGGSVDDADGGGEADSASQSAGGSGAGIESGEVCALLSNEEIESATGLVVTGSSEDNLFSTEYLTCTWTFEPVSEGIFEGEVPEFIVSASDGPFLFEQFPAEDPEIQIVDGIADGAFTRGPIAVYLKSGDKSAEVTSFFVFESGQEAAATESTIELGRLVAERL